MTWIVSFSVTSRMSTDSDGSPQSLNTELPANAPKLGELEEHSGLFP